MSLAAVATLVSAGATAYSANRASSAAAKNRKMISEQQAKQDELWGPGMELIGRGKEGQETVYDYLMRLATGSGANVRELLGPELRRMGDVSRTRQQTLSSLAPRGGMSAAAAAQNPLELEQRIGELVMGVRPNAMNALASLSGDMTRQGGGLTGQSMSSGGQLIGLAQQQNRDELDQGAMIGQALAGLFGGMQGVNWGSLFGGGGGGGGGGIPTGKTSDYLAGLMAAGPGVKKP